MRLHIMTNDGAKAIAWKLKKLIEHIEANPEFYDDKRGTNYSILFDEGEIVREKKFNNEKLKSEDV